MTALIMAILAACGPKGPLQLAPEVPGTIESGSLQYTQTAILTVEPSIGIDFYVEFDLKNTGTSPIRVDLSRSRISVDGVAYQTCRYGRDVDPATLIANLAPGATGKASVTCKDVRRPVERIDLKFAAAGTGSNGEIVAGFVGLGERH